MIAQCANLPTKIQNGTGLGGGQVVGWLPVVGSNAIYYLYFSFSYLSDGNFFKIEEDTSESGKKAYVDFKSVIWHKSFHEILATIQELSRIRYNIKCADGVVHHIFPAILILSADYEEQYNWLHVPQFDLTSILGVLWLLLGVQRATSPVLYALCQRKR